MVIVLLVLLLFPATTLAQLTPEQALNMRQVSDLSFSKDGRRVAFTVTDPVKGSDRNRDLWILDVATRQRGQLTFSPKSESQPLQPELGQYPIGRTRIPALQELRWNRDRRRAAEAWRQCGRKAAPGYSHPWRPHRPPAGLV